MRLSPADMEKFFNPESIALVGVSRSGTRLGGLSFLSKFIESGYEGRLYPINAKAEDILGIKAWPDLASLPEIPDLVIIAVGAPKVPDLIAECAEKGARHVHLLTAGFDETGTSEGKDLADNLVAACEKHGVLVIGPNCMGPYRPAARLTAWGAIPGLAGPLGIISQSGGMTQRLTEYTASLGLGVEKAVSVGNGSVTDTLDFLEAFGKDPAIRVIGIYLEGVSDGGRLLTLARDTGLDKPIVLLKGGETDAGARTAASHTGAMAGSSAVWEAVFRQANMISVHTMNEWVDALMACAFVGAPSSEGVFVLSGGGGTSVTAGDSFIREGLSVPQLSATAMQRLKELVPAAGSIAGNPLDLWKVFTDLDCLGSLVDMAEQEQDVGIILTERLIARNAFHMPETPDLTRQTIERLKERRGRKPVVFAVDSEGGDPWLASEGAAIRSAFGRAGYAVFPSISRAARALARLCRYYKKRAQMLTPKV
ncbi:MAG: CoA-binding protein [Desulfobacterales bacterium]|nr:CoA-binding protein [Desulfobacterales bacterium]